VFWDDIDALCGSDEALEWPSRTVDHVSNEVVGTAVGTVRIDPQQARKVAVLRVKWDHKRFQTRASVRDGQIRSQRCLADTPGL